MVLPKINNSSTLSGWCSSKCRTVIDFWEHHPENVELFYFLEWCTIACPATLKRTQCSGRQHQSVQFDWQAQWIRNMPNDPPLGVLQFPCKLQHMDTRRSKPLKNHQRTTPQNHSRFLNFDLRILKNATLKPPAASKSLPRHPPERPLSGSQKGPEKDHQRQRPNSEHTVGRTHEKEGVASTRSHSPISPNPSLILRMASQQLQLAGHQCELP